MEFRRLGNLCIDEKRGIAMKAAVLPLTFALITGIALTMAFAFGLLPLV